MTHAPFERLIETYELIGSEMVKTGERWRVLCGCTEDLRYDWGHPC